jgi:predicted phage terminase large subunit-like protein
VSAVLLPAEYQALVRQDLYAFVQRAFHHLYPQTAFAPNWHLEVIASKLEAVFRGEIRRLIINVPPRSLKSHCASVSFPAFWLGHDPSAQILCVSYGQDLSNKLSADTRSVMSSDWYKDLFPSTRLTGDKQSVAEFTTAQRGFRMATSIGGVLTGRGADVIIIDDPLKPDEAVSDLQRKAVNDWFDGTLYSRLNDKTTGAIIVIMQRLHMDDLVGHVRGQEKWEVLEFPAIAVEDQRYAYQTPYGAREYTRRTGEALHAEREPLPLLDALRKTVGEYNFAGQYQQNPVPLGGGLVKKAWFQTYDRLPGGMRVIQSWDTANKATQLSDYSVCTTWGLADKKIYLLDVFRARLGFPELKRAVRDLRLKYQATAVLIEDKASGTQLIQELVYEGMPVKATKPEVDKVMRMHAQTAAIENGFVYLPKEARWLAEYVNELTTFPLGKHDDQVDSTSQALGWIALDAMRPRVSTQRFPL